MKRNLKKLTLNKKAVSDLTVRIIGGLAKTNGPLTCTDPTARTFCYHCPPPNPY